MHEMYNNIFVLPVGVALTTWFDSAVLVDPPVQEARAMKNWLVCYFFSDLLADALSVSLPSCS